MASSAIALDNSMADTSNLIKNEVDTIELARKLKPAAVFRFLEIDRHITRDKARLYLAVAALLRIGDQPLTRAELFRPALEEEHDVPALKKEGMNRHWQSQYLSTLIRLSILQEHVSGGVRYYKADDAGAEEWFRLIRNFVANGKAIHKLLWPSHYTNENDVDGVGESSEEESQEAEDEAPAAVGEGVIEVVAKNLSEVAGHLGEIYKSASENNNTLVHQNEKLSVLDERLTTLISDLSGIVTKIVNGVDVQQQELNRRLADMVTRVMESEARKRSLMNQLDAESRKLEDALQAINQHLGKTNGK